MKDAQDDGRQRNPSIHTMLRRRQEMAVPKYSNVLGVGFVFSVGENKLESNHQ